MELVGDIARKTGDPAILAIEAEKTRRAAEIGRHSGLFRVPAVLDFDAEAGRLDCERIPDLVNFSEFALRDRDAAGEIAERAGHAIARVHATLELPDAMRIPLPAEWTFGDADPVCLHGDLTSNNVCVDRSTGGLVLVDWSAAPAVGRQATTGPRCFDVLFFVRHVLLGAPSRFAFGWPGPALCDRFVAGYVAGAGSPLSRASWAAYEAKLDDGVSEMLGRRVAVGSRLARPFKALAQRRLRASWRAYSPPAGSLA